MPLVLLCLVLVVACGGDAEPAPSTDALKPAASAPVAPAPAAPASPGAGATDSTATELPAGADLAQLIQGDWAIQLGDEELRQVHLLQLALQDPPATDAELEAAKLTADEKMMVGLLAAAKAANPDDPKVKDMQSAVANLHDATVRITDTQLSFTAGDVTRRSTYTVQSQAGSAITILSTDEDGSQDTSILTLEGPDVLLLADAKDAGRTQRFRRR